MDLCKDRHNDILATNQQQPRMGIDKLGRVVHKWAVIMISRNAHKALESGGESFWLSFGVIIRGSLSQVIGSGKNTDSVLSKIKEYITAERGRLERGNECVGPSKAKASSGPL